MVSQHAAQSFTWSVHPARERRGPALLTGAAILALAAACAHFGQHPAWGALCIGCLLLALNRFYFPSRFTIDDDGIAARYPLRRRRYRWQELRRFVHDRRGAYLSTRSRPSRLDAYTGLHLLFEGLFDGQRESIVARIQSGLGQARLVEENATCAG